MDRAKVICHMMTTIDGKISIDWDGNEDYEKVGDEYDRLVFAYGQAYGCGRATFQYLDETDLSGYKGEDVEYIDNVVYPEEGQFLCIAFDRYGKLRWESNVMDYGGHKSLIVEVITEQVKPEFLKYLNKLNIPYIFAGKNDFEPQIFLEKIKSLYSVDTFALCGGAEINSVFFKHDLVDEISLVIGAAIDGKREALTFAGGNDTESFPKYFKLKEAKAIDGNGVILRYTRK